MKKIIFMCLILFSCSFAYADEVEDWCFDNFGHLQIYTIIKKLAVLESKTTEQIKNELDIELAILQTVFNLSQKKISKQ